MQPESNPLIPQFWLWGADASTGDLNANGFVCRERPVGAGSRSSLHVRDSVWLHANGQWLADLGLLYHRGQERFYWANTPHFAAEPATWLEFATRLRLIPFNPASGVPAPFQERTEKQAYTRDEARTYLEASRSHRLEALFLLVLTTGLRRSEVFGLRWEDVDFETLEVRVRQRLRWIRGGGFNVGPPKTKRSRRTIPISTDTAHALLRWREQQ